MAPKRPADSYHSPANLSADSSSTQGKRVKFAATTSAGTTSGAGGAEEDLDLDEASTTAGGSKKAVVTAGYDSDSSAGSDDEFGGGGGRSKGKKKASNEKGEMGAEEDDDLEDMFGGETNAADKGKGKEKAEKSKEFLELGDIEGQEFGRGEENENENFAIEEEEEYLPDDDLANADDAPRGKRNKEGMGYQLSSFNMAEELGEGRFSTDGSYVRNEGDPLATHDSWLDGVSKAAIRAARESKLKMDQDAQRREAEELGKGENLLAQQRDDCLIGLLSLLRAGETVTNALNRLTAQKKKPIKKKVKPRLDYDDDHVMHSAEDSQPAAQTENGSDTDPAADKINRITLLASTLLAQGELEIYDESYEQIIQTLKCEGAVRRDWVPPVDPDLAKETEQKRLDAVQRSTSNDMTSSGARRPLIARPAVVPNSSVKYRYKWKQTPAGQPEGQEFGAYSAQEMSQWIQAGFFGPEAQNIWVQVEGRNEWKSWQEASL